MQHRRRLDIAHADDEPVSREVPAADLVRVPRDPEHLERRHLNVLQQLRVLLVRVAGQVDGKVLPGDRVRVAVSPYDLSHGLIVYRGK